MNAHSATQRHGIRAWAAALSYIILLALALGTGCGASGSPSTTAPPPHQPTVASHSESATSVPSQSSQLATLSRTGPFPPAPKPQVLSTRPSSPPSTAPPVIKPPISWDPIPFGPMREAEMAAYAQRHYGIDSYKIVGPHVIVIHYTETPDFQSTWNTFASDTPDPELGELPGTCAHFVIDQAGVIHQLVPLDIMCRHTVGLNWTAIGIEHVGYSDQQILDDPAQMTASLKLVRWLRCTYHIPLGDVIGHNESLSSPYHHEKYVPWRHQTHDDFRRADMEVYRAREQALGPCPTS
jgi:N-acetylmuramoyl-L-alanine amidase